MPKVKESSLRGIPCTSLVNFFVISPSASTPLSFHPPVYASLEAHFQGYTGSPFATGLTGSIERTTRHSCNCSCSRIFPFLFVRPASASYSLLVVYRGPFHRERSCTTALDTAAASSPAFSCENDCGFHLMGSDEFLSSSRLLILHGGIAVESVNRSGAVFHS